MNDLELRDLGLGRSDIPSVLAGHFDGRPDGRFRPAAAATH